MALVDNERLRPADAAILLEGDGESRIDTCIQLLNQGMADRIVVSGGVDSVQAGCIHGRDLVRLLQERGVREDKIILEGDSFHTRAQGVEVMKLATQNGWKRIILVATHYHQYRAFLTFLQALKESGLTMEILNAPARNLPWFTDPGWGCRFDLLESEFSKIEAYSKQGHVASYQEAIAYFRWKECQT